MTTTEITIGISLVSLTWTTVGVYLSFRGNHRSAIQTQLAMHKSHMEETDRAYALQIAGLRTTIDELKTRCEALNVQAEGWRKQALSSQDRAQEYQRDLDILRLQVQGIIRNT